MSVPSSINTMQYNMTYGPNNPAEVISVSQIDNMRKRLLDNISDLNANKYRIRADEFNQLLNYHHYALTILDNMKIIQHSEMTDPYNQSMQSLPEGRLRRPYIETINPYETKLKVVYQRDGRAKVVGPRSADRYVGEWEQQFDENVISPPCYSIPPSNQWGLPRDQPAVSNRKLPISNRKPSVSM